MTRQPNILLLFPDQHRGDWMPHPGAVYERLGMDPLPLRMPNLTALAARGVSFHQATTPSPLCAPARSCLASGLRYDKTGVFNNGHNHPLELKTFYSVLKEGGYTVGGCGKFDLRKPEHDFGNGTGWVPKLAALGFSEGYCIDNGGKHDTVRCGTTYVDARGVRRRRRHPEQHQPSCPYMQFLKERGLMMVHVRDHDSRIIDRLKTAPTPLPDDAYADNWVGQNAITIIEKFPAGKPWFLQVNFPGPHEPWDVTASMRAAWKDVAFPPPSQGSFVKRWRELKVRQNYAAMLENIDRNVGLILDAVARRGELDNTIIVYSSDHGEMLGDKGKHGKSLPHRGSVHVPMVISGPGISRGVSSSAMVELQDLAATFTELAGLAMPSAVDAMSLVPVLSGKTSIHRDHVVSALRSKKSKEWGPRWNMVQDDRYTLVSRGERFSLYDRVADPWETVDVAGAHPDVVERLRALLP